MTDITVRQSGGANIVSIPKVIVKTMGLRVGSKLDMSIVDNKIVLTPIEEELTLESLIAGSPKDCFIMNEEDKEWVQSKSRGNEF
jgi:antitoxin ChpS